MSKKDESKNLKIFSTNKIKSDFTQKNNFSAKETSTEVEKSTELEKSEKYASSISSEKSEILENQLDSKEILKQKYLNILIKYGILFGIFLVMTAFLVLFTLLGKNKNKKELLFAVNETLQIYCENNNLENIKAIQWKNKKIPFHTNYAIFKLDSQSSKNFSYAFIIRSATIYGPESCVYLYEPKNNNVLFVGIADLLGKSKTYIENSIKPSQISYWAQKIPNIYEYFLSEANNETE